VALTTKLEGNLEHFCSYFNLPTLQPHKKNRVLDLYTNVTQKVNLKDFELLARVTFRDILHDLDSIQRQDAIIKIPMVLFFQRLLCTLPHQMIREEMVTSYLSALTQMTSLDAAMRQTVQYAMHNLMTALEGVTITKEIHSTVVNTRSWHWSLQNLTYLNL
jgi:predicted RecB family nuclease